jgi:hypothetical protein
LGSGVFYVSKLLFWLLLEMRSAFIEVQAISEDVNGRRRKGEHPEKKYNELALCRWYDAIAALVECLVSQKSARLVAGRGAGSALSRSNHSASSLSLHW